MAGIFQSHCGSAVFVTKTVMLIKDLTFTLDTSFPLTCECPNSRAGTACAARQSWHFVQLPDEAPLLPGTGYLKGPAPLKSVRAHLQDMQRCQPVVINVKNTAGKTTVESCASGSSLHFSWKLMGLTLGS